VIHNTTLGSGQEGMVPNASLVKTRKPRFGARGVPKVKTGCQTCKYVFSDIDIDLGSSSGFWLACSVK
jgi:hypothetical protein